MQGPCAFRVGATTAAATRWMREKTTATRASRDKISLADPRATSTRITRRRRRVRTQAVLKEHTLGPSLQRRYRSTTTTGCRRCDLRQSLCRHRTCILQRKPQLRRSIHVRTPSRRHFQTSSSRQCRFRPQVPIGWFTSQDQPTPTPSRRFTHCRRTTTATTTGSRCPRQVTLMYIERQVPFEEFHSPANGYGRTPSRLAFAIWTLTQESRLHLATQSTILLILGILRQQHRPPDRSCLRSCRQPPRGMDT